MLIDMEQPADKLTHFDDNGNAIMVDVSHKKPTERDAWAQATITLTPEIYARIQDKTMEKGDVLGVARIAGIMAMKKTSDLIPLCHPLKIDACDINFECNDKTSEIVIHAHAHISDTTGVEMEALTGASVCALTIYDMCKAVDKHMVIGDIHLVRKCGGKSGDFSFSDDASR